MIEDTPTRTAVLDRRRRRVMQLTGENIATSLRGLAQNLVGHRNRCVGVAMVNHSSS